MTTTRTDENAPYYYFTESLPQHMNLTRVGTKCGRLAAMQPLCVTSGNPRSLWPLLCGNGRKEDCCGWPSKPLSVHTQSRAPVVLVAPACCRTRNKPD
jgi:hypothetical protein